MKTVMFISAIVFACYLVTAKPAKDDKCTVPESNERINVGQTASIPGKCAKVTCNDDLHISAVTCPLAQKPGCKLGKIDYSKSYPDCCPKFVCN